MIKLNNVSYQVAMAHESLSILENISLDIQQAESVAIVGASGSGKTTLLGLLAGLDTPSSGSITVAGAEISSLDEDQRAAFRAKHVGIIFQSFHLLPALTALENVILPIELAGKRDSESQAITLLEQVGHSHRLHHKPAELSGGEQQRVAIARAFAAQADILFADEPTGNLDQHTGEQIIDLLFDINKKQATTLVLVTHDLELAARCDRQLVLSHGGLVEQAPSISRQAV